MRFRILWTALACFALVLPVAVAQTTGEVYGVVRDKDGATLPGATVTMSGPQIPIGQTLTTRSDGVFRFAALPPGNAETDRAEGELFFNVVRHRSRLGRCVLRAYWLRRPKNSMAAPAR